MFGASKAAGAVLGLALAGGALAACGASTPTAASGHSQHPKSSGTTSTTTTASPSSSSTTTTSTAAATASTCQSSQLKVTEAKGGAAAGTIEVPFSIANTGSQPCSLDGYPTLTLVGPSGDLSAQVSHEGQGEVFQVAPATVTLPANSSEAAAFVLAYSDVPSGGQTSCPKVDEIEAALPGETSAVGFSQTFYPCGAPNIDVSAVITYAQYQEQFSG